MANCPASSRSSLRSEPRASLMGPACATSRCARGRRWRPVSTTIATRERRDEQRQTRAMCDPSKRVERGRRLSRHARNAGTRQSSPPGSARIAGHRSRPSPPCGCPYFTIVQRDNQRVANGLIHSTIARTPPVQPSRSRAPRRLCTSAWGTPSDAASSAADAASSSARSRPVGVVRQRAKGIQRLDRHPCVVVVRGGAKRGQHFRGHRPRIQRATPLVEHDDGGDAGSAPRRSVRPASRHDFSARNMFSSAAIASS